MVPFGLLGPTEPPPEVIRLRARCARQRAAIAELSQRLRNSLALTRAMVAHTLRGPVGLDEGRAILEARLAALGRAYETLVPGTGKAVGVRRAVEAALGPHGYADSPGRFLVRGPRASLDARRALRLFMALNELAADAAAHGRLGPGDGRVEVSWKVEREVRAPRIRLTWAERGASPGGTDRDPPVHALVRRTLALDAGEGASFAFPEDGLECRIDLRAVATASGAPKPRKAGAGA